MEVNITKIQKRVKRFSGGVMVDKKGNWNHWTKMEDLVPESLKHISPNRDNITNWLSFQWDVTVGEEIARVSRVEKIRAQTLYILVSGKEWLPVLKGLEDRVLKRLNENWGQTRISRIMFRTGVVRKPEPCLSTGKKVSAKTASNDIRPPGKNLDFIKDPELRETLKRLSQKFRFTAMIAVCVFLSNCSTFGMVEDKPTSPPVKVDLADSFAVKQIQEINKKNPEAGLRDPRAYYHYLMAMRAERQKDFKEAAIQYALAVESDPKNEAFHNKLVLYSLRTGQFERVLSYAEEALQRFPRNVDIRMVLADVLFSMGEKQKALDHYKRITDIDPGNGRAYLLTGYAQSSMDRIEEAKETFQQVTIVEPAGPFGFYYLAKTLAEQGNFDSAIEKFKKALSVRPSFLQAREHLAWYLEGQKKYREASQQYKVILKLNPMREEIKDYLEKVQASDESTVEINTSLFEQVSPPPFKDPVIHQLLGVRFYEKSAYLKTIDEFRLVLWQKEDKNLRLLLARIFELFGRLDESIEEIETFIEKGEEEVSMEILLSLARMYGLNDQIDKSISLIRKAIEIEPEKDGLYHSLALAYLSTNENELAIESMQKAISINKNKGAYHFELGALLERVGKYDDAIESMKQTLVLNPNHSNGHNFIGYMYSVRGRNLDQALEHLEKALAIQPKNGYFLDSLGWIYFKKGDFKRALAEIKRAMVYTNPDPVLYDHMGDVHFSLKNYLDAKRAWRTSLSLTLKKSDDYVGEIPDEDKLREKISSVNSILRESY